jgi:hypothetical protein
MRPQSLPDQDELSALIDEIVSELPKDEQRNYARAKRVVFERLYAGEDPEILFETPSSLFEFGVPEVVEVMKSVGVLLATLKTAIDLWTQYRKSRADSKNERLKSLKAEWTKELENTGIASDQAAQISERYAGRFLDVIA